MRKDFISSIFLLFSLVAYAQQINPASNINWTKLRGSGTPSATCQASYSGPGTASYGQPYIDAATNKHYVCRSTGWVSDTVDPTQTGTQSLSGSLKAPGFISGSMPTYNVMYYGAKGDGSTDDTAAILSAQSAAYTAGGGVLFFPFTSTGYKVAVNSLQYKSGVAWVGQSVGQQAAGTSATTTLHFYGAGGSAGYGLLAQSPVNGSLNDIDIENIVFDGSSATGTVNGIVLDAQTNSSATMQDVHTRLVTVEDFSQYQIYQNGSIWHVAHDLLTVRNYNKTSASHSYYVDSGGVPTQLTFNDSYFIPVPASTAPTASGIYGFYSNNSNLDVRFTNGTIGPTACANGIYAKAALVISGTHIEGGSSTCTTSIGVLYKNAYGAVIHPSQLQTFGTNLSIGDGSSDIASGWEAQGSINSHNSGGTADILITSGAPRTGRIGPIGVGGGAPLIVNDRWSVDGILDVAVQNSWPAVDGQVYTPTVQGSTTAGTCAYSTQTGLWSQHGKVVTFELYVAFSGCTGTGQMEVSLPVTSNSVTYGAMYPEMAGIALGSGNIPSARIAPSSKLLQFVTVPQAGGSASPISVPSSGSIFLSGSYLSQ